jgi:hypothetical protein
MSICIFDTAKGGSGYSKKLGDLHLLDSLFDVVRNKLSKCQSAEDILDRTTMKYADKINVVATYEWLRREYEFRQFVLDEIQDQFPNKNIRIAHYDEVKSAIRGIQPDHILSRLCRTISTADDYQLGTAATTTGAASAANICVCHYLTTIILIGISRSGFSLA